MKLLAVISFAALSPILAAYYNHFIIEWGRALKFGDVHYASKLRKSWHRWKAAYRSAWYIWTPVFCYVYKVNSFWEILLMAMTFAVLHWIVFELQLNKLQCRKWNYVGSTSDIDRITGKRQLTYKLILLILLTGAWTWMSL